MKGKIICKQLTSNQSIRTLGTKSLLCSFSSPAVHTRSKMLLNKCQYLMGIFNKSKRITNLSVRVLSSLEATKDEETKIEEVESSLLSVRPELKEIRENMEANALERFAQIQKLENEVTFWKSERGKLLKEKALVQSGRLARLFVSIERYDNMNEANLKYQQFALDRLNEYSEEDAIKEGKQLAGAKTVFNLYGAVKIKYDDSWSVDITKLRVPGKEHMKTEAIDLRITKINSVGLKLLEGHHYLRYLNVSDCPYFDDFCMAKLHPIHDCLEYLDISGTAITSRGFGYLRMFTALKWINLSRLKNVDIYPLIPFIAEILPPDCAIVVDDEMPSKVFGIDAPKRKMLDASKDQLLPEDHPRIGTLETGVVLYDPIDVHALWQTPTIPKYRETAFKYSEQLPLGFFTKYIKGAEKYDPLF